MFGDKNADVEWGQAIVEEHSDVAIEFAEDKQLKVRPIEYWYVACSYIRAWLRNISEQYGFARLCVSNTQRGSWNGEQGFIENLTLGLT